MRRFVGLTLLVCGVAAARDAHGQAVPTVQQVVVGPNVNMVGGPASYDPTRDPALIGDPFLQRQNEPSLALSSRNPCHLLAGANDYRAVDLEEAMQLETADAWLGVFKSFDCGSTWTSTLLPGHPLDTSAAGMSSPLRGLEAAADATVRAGTSGMFYYSGIAFNRVSNGVGKVFVSRYIDNNNKDGADPITYVGTSEVDNGTSGQFLDKPWIAVDIPRADASTCTVAGQTFPAGNVYVVYSAFLGEGNNQHTKVLFSRSVDCGRTWSNPTKLSERYARNQGTTMAVDPGTGAIYIAWREFTRPDDAGSIDSILVVKSTNGGRTWNHATRLDPVDPATGSRYRLRPFDQIPTPATFRTFMFPTMAIVPSEADGRAAGQPGRVYVAWAARGFVPLRAGQSEGDARVVSSRSLDGVSWTYPAPADDYPGAGHQIIPALTFTGGKLALAYYDLRDDAAETHEDLVVEYGQQNWRSCLESSTSFAAYLTCAFANRTAPRRHTMDLRAAIADSMCLAAGTCRFTSYSVSGGFEVGGAAVSQYVTGYSSQQGREVQLQYNRPNLPLFRKGTYPFIGDYIDIQGVNFLADGSGGYMWNTGRTPGRPAPIVYVAWGDNRDVKRPGDRNWEHFTPVVTGPNALTCEAGQGGIRNQNVYSAQLRPGLVVTAPLNAKRISSLQRSFVVVARNATPETRTYRMRATPPAGIIASFDQFRGFGVGTALTEITVVVPPRSSVSRTLFVGRPADATGQPPAPFVPVSVEEIVACEPGAPCETPASDTVFLNPDFDSPDFDSPDFDSRELHTPDFDSPEPGSPDFDSPDFDSFAITTSIRTPDFDSPDFDSPDFDSPDFDSPDFDSPDFDSGVFRNPDFDSPDFDSPDFDSATVADVSFPLYNVGNTTSAYKANLSINAAPDPNVRYQLVVRRLYVSPIAACVAGGSPALSEQNQVLVNIVDPNISAQLRDRNFNDPGRTNATFSLAPLDNAIITLRAYCRAGAPCPFVDAEAAKEIVGLGVVAQAANCVACVGNECTGGDLVQGGSECVLDEGLPPRDIYDPIPPVVLGPAPNPTVDDLDNNGIELVSFTLDATDNLAVTTVACTYDGNSLTATSSSGSAYSFAAAFPIGTTTVTCTAMDVASPPRDANQSSISFAVTVRDVTPPSFDDVASPGSPFTPSNPAEATGAAGARVFYTTPTATDTNGGPVTVNCSAASGLVSGSVFPIGVTPIDCTATDQSGVSTPPTNLFNIAVADRSAPALTVPDNMAGVPATSAAGAIVIYTVSAIDLVDSTVSVLCVPPSGAIFRLGTTPVTCTATDDAGNSTVRTFTITVVDSTAPDSFVAGVSPPLLWPPDGRIVNVLVSGQASDGQSGVARIAWTVIDEYRAHQPSGVAMVAGNGPFSITIPLIADRRGTDKDGRHYSIHLTAYDVAGNTRLLGTPLVVNVHDQSGK
jgi:hypothetical protein